MALGHGLRDDWWLLLLAAAAAALGFRKAKRHPATAARIDCLALALPVVGGLVARFEIGRFSRTLGVLLASGVPAPRAMALCGDTVGNRAISAAIGAAATSFKEGQGLSEPLARTGRFPDLAVQLIRIGEETGKLEEMLQEVAEIYDHEVRRTLDRLLALLVPVITVAMGAAIAGIIAAVMLAMLSINDLAA
jgi:general secretion pathway protein F